MQPKLKILASLRKLAQIIGRWSIGLCLLALCPAQVARAQTYANPLVSIANDPRVSYFNGCYNMITGNGASMIYRSSTDLVHWSGPTTILTVSSGFSFWTGYQVQDPATKVIWMYFCGINSGGTESLGVACAPAANSTSWTITSFSIANSIDPWFIQDANADGSVSMYLYYKNDSSGDKSIWVQKLSTYDTATGSPIELVSPTSDWDACGGYPTCEGPCVKKISGKYFLLFAGGLFSSECYAIGYAYSSSPTGPFTQSPNNPMMSSSTSPGWSIGAPSIVTDAADNNWVAYRTWATPNSGTRQVCIEPLDISDAANGVLTCAPTIDVSQPAPSGVDDFDQDGIPDAVYFDTSGSKWNVRHSSDASTNSFQFGATGDIPLLGGVGGGDFNGDGKADAVIYRPSTHNWYVRDTATGNFIYDAVTFGTNGCIPLVGGDFDGDSIPDFVYVDTNSWNWHVRYSNGGSTHAFQFGGAGDVPLLGSVWPGQSAPSAVCYAPSTCKWYVRDMNNGNMITDALVFGAPGVIPLVGGDWDGDGTPDFVYVDPSSLTWYVRNSSDGSTNSFQFGAVGDIPMLGGSYSPSSTSVPNAIVYRPSTQTWYIRNSASFQFGSATAIPVH